MATMPVTHRPDWCGTTCTVDWLGGEPDPFGPTVPAYRGTSRAITTVAPDATAAIPRPRVTMAARGDTPPRLREGDGSERGGCPVAQHVSGVEHHVVLTRRRPGQD